MDGDPGLWVHHGLVVLHWNLFVIWFLIYIEPPSNFSGYFYTDKPLSLPLVNYSAYQIKFLGDGDYKYYQVEQCLAYNKTTLVDR